MCWRILGHLKKKIFFKIIIIIFRRKKTLRTISDFRELNLFVPTEMHESKMFLVLRR